MKILISILFLISSIPVFGQKLPQKVGAIEIKKINHHFIKNKEFEFTKLVTNKQNRAYAISYFDTLGNLVEEAGYGKHHNTDLRLLDYVVVNKFEKSEIVESIRYETDYEKQLSPQTKTQYYYNKKNQLVREDNINIQTDSLFLQFLHEYDSTGNQIKTFLGSPDYYYQNNYDSFSKRISLQQIHENKLRWEYLYTYTDTTRVGDFRTYYDDGKNYTKQEVTTYRDGKIIQTKERYTSSEGLSEMRKYYYDEAGLLNKIEYYRAYSSDNIFRLESYTDFKIKSKCALHDKLIEKLNDTLLITE